MAKEKDKNLQETENQQEEVKETKIETPEIQSDELAAEPDSDTQKDVKELIDEKKAEAAVEKEPNILDMESLGLATRQVEAASRNARRRIYAQEKIITRTGVDEVGAETASSARAAEYSILADALMTAKFKNNIRQWKVLRGKIIGMDPDHSILNTPCALVELEDSAGFFSIYIPANFLYNFGESEKFTTEQKIDEIMYRDNGKISFVPLYISEKEGYCIASRVHAMAKEGYDSYEKLINDKPLIEPGVKQKCLVDATIVKVTPNGVVVDANGAECFIPNVELSYTIVLDPTTIYQNGEHLLVRIKKAEKETVIVNGDKGAPINLWRIEASAKEAEPKPEELFFHNFKVNCTYHGVVKAETGKGKYLVTLRNQMDVLCNPHRFTKANIGQQCTVRVDQMFEDTKLITGTIIHLGSMY